MDILDKIRIDAENKENTERVIVEDYSKSAKEFGIDAIPLGCYIASAYRWYDSEKKKIAIVKACTNARRMVDKSL